MAYVVAVVGAGGKTSYIDRMAKRYAAEGKRVAVTTTTHRFLEGEQGQKQIRYVGAPQGEKYGYPGDRIYDELCRDSDVLLVEADGARHRPLKIPGDGEPVIPRKVQKIVVMMGSMAIGRRFSEVCHRSRLAPREWMDQKVDQTLIDRLAERFYLDPLRMRYPGVELEYRMSEAAEEREREEEKEPITLVLLASGSSRRFGAKNKLLAAWKGKPLYCCQLDALLEAKDRLQQSGLSTEIMVVSCHREILTDPNYAGIVSMVPNPWHAEGISASVRLGARLAPGAVAYFAADQPFFGGEDVVRLLKEYRRSGKAMACAYSDHAANPAVFSGSAKKRLLKIEGDKGPIGIIRSHPTEVYYYVVAAEKLRDIDTPEQWKRMERDGSGI